MVSLFIYAVTYIKIMFSPEIIGKRYNIEPVSIFLGGIYNGKRKRTGVLIAGLAVAASYLSKKKIVIKH